MEFDEFSVEIDTYQHCEEADGDKFMPNMHLGWKIPNEVEIVARTFFEHARPIAAYYLNSSKLSVLSK